ncbi:ATP-dependent RNA helicase DHX36 [Lachnellula cervina]|uniref:RNA helicase n=1 Tax=Lachnellula cervina TaxID=1316786 RepID=A0A7D8Z3C0_9HELO|nr:ATP-dependent RNA helicase DHX36 [Lachnellula cervina]
MKFDATARGCARRLEAAILLHPPTPSLSTKLNVKSPPLRIPLLSPFRDTPRLARQSSIRDRHYYATQVLALVRHVVPEDYPHAPPSLFTNPMDMHEWEHALFLCSQPPTRTITKVGNAYSCSFEVHVSDNRKYKTEKVAPRKHDAILAATRDMLLNLHHNGVLLEHFSDLQPPEVEGEVPTPDDYPEVPPRFFDLNPNELLEWHALFSSEGVSRRTSRSGQVHVCTFTVEVSQARKYKTICRSLSSLDARLAATRAMLIKLHNNGVLGKHVRTTMELENLMELENPMDSTEIAQWQEKYPEAPAEFFGKPNMLRTLFPGWNSHRRENITSFSYGKWKCFTEIRFTNHTYNVTRYSNTKDNAQLVAAQAILRRLHDDGALKGAIFKLLHHDSASKGEIFKLLPPRQYPRKEQAQQSLQFPMQHPIKPSPPNEGKAQSIGSSQRKDFGRSIFAPKICLSEETITSQLKQEYAVKVFTRAVSDIYNYGATVLATPHFEIRSAAEGQYTVTIQISELDIQVEGSGSFERAILNASLELKAVVEKYHLEHGVDPISMRSNSTLNMENAKPFLAFYNTYCGEARITFDSDPVLLTPGMPSDPIRVSFELDGKKAFGDLVRVKVKLNGKKIGQAMIAGLVNESRIADLIAAIDLVKNEPELLKGFLKTSLGRVLKPAQKKTIPLIVGPEILSKMDLASDRFLQKRSMNDEPAFDEQEFVIRSFHSRRVLSLDSAKERNRILKDNHDAFQNDDSQAPLRYLKSTFPMNQSRDKVLDLVNQNVYSIIIGATGSGKTTQLPQIILEDAIRRGVGSTANIICTQPRRIAAISVARRVAAERSEKLQNTVGYHIKHDSRLPNDDGSITYCTTGILLKLLQHRPDEVMDRLSHIIIDEVHERDRLTDYLMVIVKMAVEKRQQTGKRIPRITLMSATLNTDLFQDYFGKMVEGRVKIPCPLLAVPGRSFGIEELYLEDILTEFRKAYQPPELNSLQEDRATREYLELEKTLVADSQADVIDSTRQTNTEEEASLVPAALVATTIAHVAGKSSNGAILAFLPGLEEIIRVEKLLRTNPLGANFNNEANFKIILLHSSSRDGQDAVFEALPDGCRKIILSTNIAETSITIPDVQHVVDTGKCRQHWYNPQTRISKLQSTWISETNLKQRAGRAGRVQNGNYYALFSRARRNTFRAFELSEIHRSDLQEMCLDVKAQSFQTPIEDFLAAAIEPPLPENVKTSIHDLKDLEAITDDEKLTPLGRLLASLPVHPELGKLIVLGIIFRCFDSLLIIGAAAQERRIFLRPPLEKKAADKARKAFGYDTRSDPLTLINAFREARRLSRQNDPDFLVKMREKFLDVQAYNSISRTMFKIEVALVNAGLIPYSPRSNAVEFQRGHPSINRNSNSLPLLKALSFAGYRGNLAIRLNINQCQTRKARAVLHPHSLNWIPNGAMEERMKMFQKLPSSVYSYHRMDQSTKNPTLFLQDSTQGSALMAALFGFEVQSVGENLIVDKWLPLNITSSLSEDKPHKIILQFRKALDLMISDAFSSLAKQGGKSRYLADDPLREEFAAALTTVLENEGESESEGEEGPNLAAWGNVEADYAEAVRLGTVS